MEPMAPLDFTDILKNAPPGDWIALATDESHIVATAKTLSDALQAARDLGEEDPVLVKVPPPGLLVL